MFKRALITLSLLALAACSPSAEKQEARGPAIQLYAIDCGRAAFNDVGMFADDHSMDGQARNLVVPCYLIRHPSGDLIWDTGLPDSLADGAFTDPSMGATLSRTSKLVDSLAQLNLTPADIEFVSFSHAHADHTGNGNLFANSTWIVDADERAYMFRPEARADATSFNAYNRLENARTQQIEGDGDYDVFGDGSVVIVQAPGHTPGHTILRVNLQNAGTVLLTGDMWHLSESRQNRLVPTFNRDRAQTLASMDKVEALATETNALVIREHVQEDFDALPRFPEALN